MIPTVDKIHLKFKLNGISYNHNELKEVAYNLIKEGETYENEIGVFLLDWLDSKDYILVSTSGTTGSPKRIKLNKIAMVNSAIMTGDYFNLKPGNKALHCLPSRFISGKMMLVRAMILGLELDMVAPTLSPSFNNNKHYHFGAMIPLQLKNSIEKISNMETLIIGGASVSKPLFANIQKLSTHIYETFGMTETISHIAVKKLNHNKSKASVFETLPKVNISINDQNCLIIDAPKLSNETIVTKDVIDLKSENQFELKGRLDNMINTGGVKVFPELIEQKLQDEIAHRFFIASEPDTDFGQKVVLIIEKDSNEFDKDLFSVLQKHEIPKVIYNCPKFFETETGKLQRQKTLDSVLKSFTH